MEDRSYAYTCATHPQGEHLLLALRLDFFLIIGAALLSGELREAEAKKKAEEDARQKKAKLDEELAGRAEELERERRQRDAEDEAKIQASERALAAAGVVNDVATAASVRF